MENNIQNKAKFFAQYWGQHILRFSLVDVNSPNSKPTDVVLPTWVSYKEYNYWSVLNGYLELKPLSSITDEDAIEVATIYNKSIKGSPFPL